MDVYGHGYMSLRGCVIRVSVYVYKCVCYQGVHESHGETRDVSTATGPRGAGHSPQISSISRVLASASQLAPAQLLGFDYPSGGRNCPIPALEHLQIWLVIDMRISINGERCVHVCVCVCVYILYTYGADPVINGDTIDIHPTLQEMILFSWSTDQSFGNVERLD